MTVVRSTATTPKSAVQCAYYFCFGVRGQLKSEYNVACSHLDLAIDVAVSALQAFINAFVVVPIAL